MAYWWETYDDVPANNTSTPPDGAPEGHFPSAVNDIARQAMAAGRGGAPPVSGFNNSPPSSATLAIACRWISLTADGKCPSGAPYGGVEVLLAGVVSYVSHQ